ncbi:MAG: hypothetical protein AAB804_02285 [Patescibacteria group bacterium]
MSNEIEISGVQYISSKRASELSGYAQDYIGQLARGGYIDAKRVGGLWHVSLTSLEEYEKNSANNKSKQPERTQQRDPDAVLSFEGKDYISAPRAAKITGYHQDYVGQLARSGSVTSRQVGNRWYVDREALLAHKSEKDRLLAAVQSESVGISRKKDGASEPQNTMAGANPRQGGDFSDLSNYAEKPYLTYTSDTSDLIPLIPDNSPVRHTAEEELPAVSEDDVTTIPIRIKQPPPGQSHEHYRGKRIEEKGKNRKPGKAAFYTTLGGAAVVLAILAVGSFVLLKKDPTYAGSNPENGGSTKRGAFLPGTLTVLGPVVDALRNLFVSEIVYRREQ